MSRREKELEQELCQWCEEHGLACLKLQIDGVRGFPDRTILGFGHTVFVELKDPQGELSPQQKYMMNCLESYGHPCYVFDNLSDAVDALEIEFDL